MSEEDSYVHLSRQSEFPFPPYLPKSSVVKRDMWKMYNNISEMDRQLGAVLKQLEKDDLLENTLIIFYGDHGGPLPRQKRLIYESGLNTPMIIRFPNKRLAGSEDDQFCRFCTYLTFLGRRSTQIVYAGTGLFR
ncbi:sulfatase-like hydrolase/transferase [Lunatibacter salilacus]|uniref:sulfatase-like hydrolase/transferase n=1 Tax=Lunatibacter salilacus TaxID=2483804 RepID=UPI001F2C418F|nr:sulfatase-like hydrolase/transferase [Lunatibacter salilacus]